MKKSVTELNTTYSRCPPYPLGHRTVNRVRRFVVLVVRKQPPSSSVPLRFRTFMREFILALMLPAWWLVAWALKCRPLLEFLLSSTDFVDRSHNKYIHIFLTHGFSSSSLFGFTFFREIHYGSVTYWLWFSGDTRRSMFTRPSAMAVNRDEC